MRKIIGLFDLRSPPGSSLATTMSDDFSIHQTKHQKELQTWIFSVNSSQYKDIFSIIHQYKHGYYSSLNCYNVELYVHAVRYIYIIENCLQSFRIWKSREDVRPFLNRTLTLFYIFHVVQLPQTSSPTLEIYQTKHWQHSRQLLHVSSKM